jgi:hypothetical protein
MMKYFPALLAALMLAELVFPVGTVQMYSGSRGGRCIGADPCYACSNCKYCAHCGKGGGTCGVCKKKR